MHIDAPAPCVTRSSAATLLCRINGSLPLMRKDLNYLYHIKFPQNNSQKKINSSGPGGGYMHSNLLIIGSGYALLSVWYKTIITKPMMIIVNYNHKVNFSEIWVKMWKFTCKNMQLKIVSTKWQTFSSSHCGLVISYDNINLGSILAQVMACCPTAPNHYLNQCWLSIPDMHHSAISLKMNMTLAAEIAFEKDISKFLAESTNEFTLPHLPLVPHVCISALGQHWFRQWLVT